MAAFNSALSSSVAGRLSPSRRVRNPVLEIMLQQLPLQRGNRGSQPSRGVDRLAAIAVPCHQRFYRPFDALAEN